MKRRIPPRRKFWLFAVITMVTSSKVRSHRFKRVKDEDPSELKSFRARSRSTGSRRTRSSTFTPESSSDEELECANKVTQKTNTNNTVKEVTITGNGMTIWWLALFAITFCFRFEQTARQWAFSLDTLPLPAMDVIWKWVILTSPNSVSSPLRLFQGVSTVSALCVGIGYYIFKICFRRVQGSMAWQLYTQLSDPKPVPFWGFYILDILVHFVLVIIVSYYWWKHVDTMSVLITWVYNRLWSYVHSKGENWYFCRVEEVYGFHKPMPPWSYVVLYLSESIVVGYGLYNANRMYNM